MSGGYFDYNQYHLGNIADSIERQIERATVHNYTEETIKEFKNAIDALRRAEIYAQRVDYLICGDDGEESFHRRLKEELKKYEEQNNKNLKNIKHEY